MRQSNVIFGTLIFAFIVFITMRGQLPAYLDLFKSKPPAQKSPSNSGSSLFDKIKGVLGNVDLSNIASGFGNLFDSKLSKDAAYLEEKSAIAGGEWDNGFNGYDFVG